MEVTRTYTVIGLRRRDAVTATVEIAVLEGGEGGSEPWITAQTTIECPLGEAPQLGSPVEGTYTVTQGAS